MLIIGLMSGTSLDGITAALVEVDGETTEDLRWQVRGARTEPYDDARRRMIHDVILGGGAAGICSLHARLGEWFGEAAVGVCGEAGVALDEVALIGSHGQTIWHEPPEEGKRGSTLQLGDPATIAEITDCDVVSDFRTRDMAAGGHGAPLVPWVDRVLFSREGGARALQNLGGIGNVTWVPPRGAAAPLLAFDTGPANSLIDAAVHLATGGRRDYDEDGRLAAGGVVDGALLAELLRHPFFDQEPPRSTGRETFGVPFVQRLVEAVAPEGDQDWLDLIATLTELSARSIADSYRRWILPRGVDEVVLTGGGARNRTLVGRLEALLEPVPVYDGVVLGVDPEVKEALAFAVLAWAHVKGIPANEPGATGAAGPRLLGSFTPAAADRPRR